MRNRTKFGSVTGAGTVIEIKTKSGSGYLVYYRTGKADRPFALKCEDDRTYVEGKTPDHALDAALKHCKGTQGPAVHYTLEEAQVEARRSWGKASRNWRRGLRPAPEKT